MLRIFAYTVPVLPMFPRSSDGNHTLDADIMMGIMQKVYTCLRPSIAGSHVDTAKALIDCSLLIVVCFFK